MREELSTPTFLVDEAKARSNIERIAAKAARCGAAFRPHFKTHQSLFIGNWYRDYGVDRITVSSVTMAGIFAAGGWRDLTIAFPVNLRELGSIDELAGKVDLGLLVDSEAAVEALAAALTHAVRLWIKVDLGTHRCGIPAAEGDAVLRLARTAAAIPRLRIAGLLAHDGRTYSARGREAVERLYREGRDALLDLKARLAASGFPGLAVSYGDTPTASLVEDFSGIDELRPGNFVYYDLQQRELGSCSDSDIAAAVACPVVGIYPERGEAVVYGGAVHLSKQDEVMADGRGCYGAAFRSASGGVGARGRPDCSWGGFVEGAYLRSLSQEHGVAVLPSDELARLRLGDLLLVCPVHSCLAQDLLRGSTKILR
jgi:D-serine deaminase-like pyridoxal phosphate-dependent protein